MPLLSYNTIYYWMETQADQINHCNIYIYIYICHMSVYTDIFRCYLYILSFLLS